MPHYYIFAIYLFLTKSKKTTAKELAKKFELSTRSIYRYIDSLSLLGVPIVTKQGRSGGIELVGNSYIESLCFTNDEKQELKNFVNGKANVKKVKQIIKKII